MTRRPCIACGRLITNASYCKTCKPRNGSTRQWRTLRTQILARDRYTCQLCGAAAEHIDHIRPVAAGGSDQPGNLRATCAECNLRKGSKRGWVKDEAGGARTSRPRTASEAAKLAGGSPDAA